ncbi:hypothetical protein N7462_002231 [Penicillium macrosclerotiorum]|uniref:uncharacterized protein n=1 Tax=Penicillium macrosclerotiorum TaxID=303699 RepID=UPI002548F920|nr:uncharacterized protein N7462_002231 [Penicillium macrosclerotiorum]KAJ5692808.1 hypothetical protein N7462_002231 [Penicillium macrosclerotiorum]
MVDVRSKNLYELLGNIHPFAYPWQRSRARPLQTCPPPARAVDRPSDRIGKRDAPKEAPVTTPKPSSGRRGGRGPAGNDGAFRDRNAGRANNRAKPTDEAEQPPRRNRAPRGDRQSRTGQTDTRKQVQQGWGGESGDKNLADEQAGEKIAESDEKEPQTPAEEEEPDNSKSFSAYLAEQAEKSSLAAKPVRVANDGVEDSKWASAVELKKEESDYFQRTSEKKQREKQRKEKNFLDVDIRYTSEQPATSSRGGRGGPRGGRAPRGDRPARGAPRGGARGTPTTPRGRAANTPVSAGPTVDEKNFPSLGGN